MKNNASTISLWLVATLLLCTACDKPQHQLQLIEQTEQNRLYEYNGNKIILVRQTLTSTYYMDSPDEKDKTMQAMPTLTLNYEDFYTYDNRDSLVSIESYDVTNGKREQRALEKYTDTSFESINLNANGDTLSHYWSKKDQWGREMENYNRVRLIDLGGEEELAAKYLTTQSTQVFEYEDNRLSRTAFRYSENEKQAVRTYRYHTIGDTLLTEIRLDGFLEQHTKRFVSKEYEVETIRYFEYGGVNDSIYYLNGKNVRSASYDAASKRITVSQYDSKGNIVRSINEVWEIR